MQNLFFSATMLLALSTPLLAATITTEKATIDVSKVAGGLNHPWGMAFLPDGRMLVTERSGALQLISADGKTKTAITGLPAIDVRGQGGLLDVILAKDFADSKQIFFSYSEPADGKNSTAVASARNSRCRLTAAFIRLPKKVPK